MALVRSQLTVVGQSRYDCHGGNWAGRGSWDHTSGTARRSTGRLNISQLAIEADVKRWHLTHQHRDLKDLFQARAAEHQAKQSRHVRDADAYNALQRKHADLQAPRRTTSVASVPPGITTALAHCTATVRA